MANIQKNRELMVENMNKVRAQLNEDKMDKSFLKKIETVIKKELGVSRLIVTGPYSSRFIGEEKFLFSVKNAKYMIKVTKQDFVGMYEDFYHVGLADYRGHWEYDSDGDRRIKEKDVLNAVSSVAKKYKDKLTK